MNWHRVWAKLAFAPLKEIRWCFPAATGKVYLTFDDGPFPGVTEQVLAILAREGVPATFFLSGIQLYRNRRRLADLDYAGHRVGNHCFHHRGMACQPGRRLVRQLQFTDRLIARHIGAPARLCRPPYGIFAGGLLNAARHTGHRLVLWSLMAYDFALPPERTLERLCRLTRPGDIVVFHDSPLAAGTVIRVLPHYIAWCRQQGLRFGVVEAAGSGN
ncbi:MAG: polysaccharide deacetylase family protein [Calditrichaeota bacterium]|nr:MAG: polysaccharide deacetylase family protein [Calditrichota bacterium]